MVTGDDGKWTRRLCSLRFDDMDEVEDLLIGLILEGKVEGKIDQVSMRLELTTKYVTPRQL